MGGWEHFPLGKKRLRPAGAKPSWAALCAEIVCGPWPQTLVPARGGNPSSRAFARIDSRLVGRGQAGCGCAADRKRSSDQRSELLPGSERRIRTGWTPVRGTRRLSPPRPFWAAPPVRRPTQGACVSGDRSLFNQKGSPLRCAQWGTKENGPLERSKRNEPGSLKPTALLKHARAPGPPPGW